ncbi:MAG: hypothetical protein ACP5NA_07920, partial [Candidatus Acidulodesulfobacterium sp.]
VRYGVYCCKPLNHALLPFLNINKVAGSSSNNNDFRPNIFIAPKDFINIVQYQGIKKTKPFP